MARTKISARSRHEADGGMLLEGIHPDTIVEMSLAAKREVDSLRAELEEERRRNSLGLVPCVKCGNYEVVGQPCSWCRALATRRSAESRAEAAEASIALERVTIAEMKLEAHQLRTNLHIARIERDAARADLAKLNRALADERAAVVIAHERMDALAAERDDFRKRINEIRAHVPEKWDGDSGDFAGTVVAILSCPHGEPGHYWKDGCPECCAVEHEALRAHATAPKCDNSGTGRASGRG